MKKKLESIFAYFQELRLSDEERARVRAALSLYIQTHSLQTKTKQPIHSSYTFHMPNLWRHRARVLVTAFAAVMLLFGGVSSAAANALPGDVLYSVKVSVNEPVRSALLGDTSVGAAYEVERAKRRLAETETLALSGKLSDTVREDLEKRFKEHIETALEFEKDDTIDERIDATLLVHGELLASLPTAEQTAHAVREVRARLALVPPVQPASPKTAPSQDAVVTEEVTTMEIIVAVSEADLEVTSGAPVVEKASDTPTVSKEDADKTLDTADDVLDEVEKEIRGASTEALLLFNTALKKLTTAYEAYDNEDYARARQDAQEALQFGLRADVLAQISSDFSVPITNILDGKEDDIEKKEGDELSDAENVFESEVRGIHIRLNNSDQGRRGE